MRKWLWLWGAAVVMFLSGGCDRKPGAVKGRPSAEPAGAGAVAPAATVCPPPEPLRDARVSAAAASFATPAEVEAFLAALRPEAYEGVLRGPAGLVAFPQGNGLDRCLVGRALLCEKGVETKLRVAGSDCSLERVESGGGRIIPTGPAGVDDPTAAAPAQSEMPVALHHRLRVSESFEGSADGEVLFEAPVAHLFGRTLELRYLNEDGLRLEVRLGGVRVALGADVTGAGRQDVVFEHVRPGGEPGTRSFRTLFDAASLAGNASPDTSDLYWVWVGSGLVDWAFPKLAREDGDQSLDPPVGRVLTVFAAFLDDISRKLAEAQGAQVSFREPRVLIAAVERRRPAEQSGAPAGPLEGPTLSLDILNNRRWVEGSDPAGTQLQLGLADGAVEAMMLEAVTGQVPLSALTVLAGLWSAAPRDIEARAASIGRALVRLRDEGSVGDAVDIYDERSGAAVRVGKQVDGLLVEYAHADASGAVAAGAPLPEGVTLVDDGVLFGGGAVEPLGGLIDLALLAAGADPSYLPRLRLQLSHGYDALLAPAGSSLAVSASDGTRLAGALHTDPYTNLWVSWQLLGQDGIVQRTGYENVSDAMSDRASSPTVLRLWSTPDRKGLYDSPILLGITDAATIRARRPVEVSFLTAATQPRRVRMVQFADETRSLVIDGTHRSVPAVRASDRSGAFQVVLAAREGSRLALEVSTPDGAWSLTEIASPSPRRLLGRVVDATTGDGIEGARAEVTAGPGAGGSTVAWPDGSVDRPLEETRRPTLPASLLLLVDDSGSMGEPLDRSCSAEQSGCATRMDALKGALRALAEGGPGRVEVGILRLSQYLRGTFNDSPWQHGYETHSSDCSRELFLSLDSDELRSFADGLRSGCGGTPLTSSVERALRLLGDQALGARRRLVVLTDGENTENRDGSRPAASAVGELPPGLDIYTIGFGMTAGSKAEAELRELAAGGGGEYRAAAGAEELSLIFRELAEGLPEEHVTASVTVRVSAPRHPEAQFAVPLDDPAARLAVERDGLTDPTGNELVALLPGDDLDAAGLDVGPDALRLVREHRGRSPSLAVLIPRRPVPFGLTKAAPWIEIDLATGELTTLTEDGLHGSVQTPERCVCAFADVVAAFTGLAAWPMFYATLCRAMNRAIMIIDACVNTNPVLACDEQGVTLGGGSAGLLGLASWGVWEGMKEKNLLLTKISPALAILFGGLLWAAATDNPSTTSTSTFLSGELDEALHDLPEPLKSLRNAAKACKDLVQPPHP